MIEREGMMRLLKGAREVFPICIPSWKRWDRKDNKTMAKLIEESDDEIKDKTILFVRRDQYELYKENYPNTRIVVLPPVNGLASTRQFVEDYMYEVMHQPYFIDIDDDITSLKAVFLDEGKPRMSRAGEVSVGEVIRLSCEIAKMAFELDDCLLGKPHRTRFANTLENTQTAYVTNKGATPRSVTFINARGLRRKGIKRNMIFDPTGDDVGFVAEIAKAHGNMFNIPCLAYSFVDDEINSVIRNDNNRRQLAAYEYDCLKKYPMRNYLRIPFKYEDGSYKYSDIDFTKYRKLTGAETHEVSLETFMKVMERRRANQADPS